MRPACPGEVNNEARKRHPVVVVHGGAGGHTDEIREHAAEYREALEEALSAGAEALESAAAARSTRCEPR